MDLTTSVSAASKKALMAATDSDILKEGETTGSSKADVWIKVTQKLGFPVLVAGALLWIFNGLIDDYRDSVKAGTASMTSNAHATTEATKGITAISKAIERLDLSFDTFEKNQLETHTILKLNQEVMKSMESEQRKTNEILTHKPGLKVP
jgi:hypothetical protein